MNGAMETSLETIRIEPSKGWVALRLDELWQYRELLYFLAWRDIKVRYKQTALGAAWAVIQPFFTMVVFSLFFGRLAGLSSDGVPYPLFSYAALVPWTFFANGLAQSADSLVGSANLVRKCTSHASRFRLRRFSQAPSTSVSRSSFCSVMMVVLRCRADRQCCLAAAVRVAGRGRRHWASVCGCPR